MKKALLFCIIAFLLGFLTHALFFPDFLANGITDISRIAIPSPSPIEGTTQLDPLMTKVDFDGVHFSRHNVTVRVSRYIQITNTSTNKLMWLLSTTPLLATNRGYGQGEVLQERMDKKGQYVVWDKNNRKEKMLITVK